METAALRAALPPYTPIVGMFANGALDVAMKGLRIYGLSTDSDDV